MHLAFQRAKGFYSCYCTYFLLSKGQRRQQEAWAQWAPCSSRPQHLWNTGLQISWLPKVSLFSELEKAKATPFLEFYKDSYKSYKGPKGVKNPSLVPFLRWEAPGERLSSSAVCHEDEPGSYWKSIPALSSLGSKACISCRGTWRSLVLLSDFNNVIGLHTMLSTRLHLVFKSMNNPKNSSYNSAYSLYLFP